MEEKEEGDVQYFSLSHCLLGRFSRSRPGSSKVLLSLYYQFSLAPSERDGQFTHPVSFSDLDTLVCFAYD